MALPRDATDGRDGLMDGDLPGGLEGAPALGGCSGCCGPVRERLRDPGVRSEVQALAERTVEGRGAREARCSA